MVKVIIRILFICIISILLNFIYQVFFTYEKFNGNPVLFFPHLNYPTFVIITFIIGFLFEKHIMKSKKIWTFAFALLVTLSFIFIAKFIENKYGYIYKHYYEKSPYTNLTYLTKYNESKGNYLTLSRELIKEGIEIHSIDSGLTDNGNSHIRETSFKQMIYYINDEFYIIFDWDSEKITTNADKQFMQKAFSEQMGEHSGEINRFSGTFISVKNNNGSSATYNLVPTNNNKIYFREI